VAAPVVGGLWTPAKGPVAGGLPNPTRLPTWEEAVAAIPGKVHRYKFDEDSGFPQDSIGTLHVTSGGGTITRQLKSPVGYAMGMTAAMATTGLTNMPLAGNWRMVAAVLRTPTIHTSHKQVLSYGPTGTTRQWVSMCMHHDSISTNCVLFWSDDHKRGGPHLSDTKWHLFAWRYHARSILLDVDGTHSVGTTGGDLNTINSGNLSIGDDFEIADIIISKDSAVTDLVMQDLWDAFRRQLNQYHRQWGGDR
jgi:hypothetical protein